MDKNEETRSSTECFRSCVREPTASWEKVGDEELRRQEATGDDLCSMHKGLAEFLILAMDGKTSGWGTKLLGVLHKRICVLSEAREGKKMGLMQMAKARLMCIACGRTSVLLCGVSEFYWKWGRRRYQLAYRKADSLKLNERWTQKLWQTRSLNDIAGEHNPSSGRPLVIYCVATLLGSRGMK